MSRVPVHIVTGTDRALARALMDRCVSARPEWAALELLGCPCCTGRAELQVRLARLLRDRCPARVLVRLDAPSHQTALERVLTSWPLAQYVVPGRLLSVPADAALRPEVLDAAERLGS